MADDELMHKPRRSQRVTTVKARPLHLDAEHAIEILGRGVRNLPATILEEIVF